MKKKNKKKNPDEETLKHYTSYSELDVPAGIPKPSGNSKGEPPQYVKPDISVDKIMSHRKNAVINNTPPEKDSDD